MGKRSSHAHFVENPHPIIIHTILANRGQYAGGFQAIHHLDLVCAQTPSPTRASQKVLVISEG